MKFSSFFFTPFYVVYKFSLKNVNKQSYMIKRFVEFLTFPLHAYTFCFVIKLSFNQLEHITYIHTLYLYTILIIPQ
jgi:hypothetical protein